MSDLINDRNSTHGGIREVAWNSQQIKNAIFDGNNAGKLSGYQIEALEMIAHKIARILSGNPNFKDHWVDIAGYAQIVVDELEKEESSKLDGKETSGSKQSTNSTS